MFNRLHVARCLLTPDLGNKSLHTSSLMIVALLSDRNALLIFLPKSANTILVYVVSLHMPCYIYLRVKCFTTVSKIIPQLYVLYLQ